jgi:hypothetical protein
MKHAAWVSRIVMIVIAALCGVARMAIAADADPEALKGATAWLAIVDAGKYEESWNEAHSMFKAQVTKEQWAAGIKDLTTRLGKIKSRNLKETTPTKTLPQAPPGDYVVFIYDSAYENLPAAIDTVVTSKDKDGAWRVAGYFVRPAGQ